MSEGRQHAEALACMRAQRWAEAERLLRGATAARGDDAVAWRLLGTVLHLTGRGEAAREKLERAVALAPDDTSALLNLGDVHLQAGRLDAARSCFEAVVRLEPEAADGHFNLGLTALRSGDPDTAEAHLCAALERQPDDAQAHSTLGLALFQRGQLADALDRAGRALALDPSQRQALVLRVRAALRAQDTLGAGAALEEAVRRLGPDPVLSGLGAELHYLNGRLPEAAQAYREAMFGGDSRRETALGWARCLLEGGETQAAVQALDEVSAGLPDEAEVHALHGLALREAGQAELALAAYGRALRLQPDSATSTAMQARLLFDLGRDSEAWPALQRAEALAPDAVAPRLLRVERHIADRDLPAALQVCEAFMARRGAQCNLVAAQAFLLHALGREAECAWLMDYPRLVWSARIEAPAGFDDVAAFNAALCRHLRAHPSLTAQGAATKATQHGRQSGNLLFGQRGPFEAFEQCLWRAARSYIDAMPRDAGHPFLRGAPPLEGVHCWAVVLGRAGHQTPHIHPTGWLSGVYYPELPDIIRQEAGQQGWIEFGAPPPELACERQPPTFRLRPEEGRIVLFPSYLYHHTLPYHSDQERVSIAFDFRPGRPPAAVAGAP